MRCLLAAAVVAVTFEGVDRVHSRPFDAKSKAFAQSTAVEAVSEPATPDPVVETPSSRQVLPDEVGAIARDLNCPLCQGYSLLDCPLEVCAQMRELIGTRLAAGETRDEIVDAFVRDYGPQVLASPPTEGFFLMAWVLPVTTLLAGLAIALAYLRKSVRLAASADAARNTDTKDWPSAPHDGQFDEAVEQLVRRDA